MSKRDGGSATHKKGQSPDRHTLYFLMCRATCARCWHILLELARMRRWLVQQNTEVVVVVAAHNLASASNLALQWGLSFSFTPAKYAVSSLEAGLNNASGNHSWALVLTDSSAVARYRLDGADMHDLLNHAGLRSMIECLNLANTPYAAACCPKTHLSQVG